MNLKTLILVLCITLISSHPVKEENNDIYDYGDFDETETVTQNDIIASALTLNMTTSEKMTKTAEEITTATTTEEITTTTEKMTTTTEKMTTTTEKMTTTTEKMTTTTEKEDCNFLNLLRDENKIYHFQFLYII